MRDNFMFTPENIQVLLLLVRDIVEEQRYLTGLVQAKESMLFQYLLKITSNMILFYARDTMITQDGMITSALLVELAKISHPKSQNYTGEPRPTFPTLLENYTLYKKLAAKQSVNNKVWGETYD